MGLSFEGVDFGSHVPIFGRLNVAGVDVCWFQESMVVGLPFTDLVSVNHVKGGVVRVVVVDPAVAYSVLPAVIPAYSVLGVLSAMGVSVDSFTVANSLVFDGGSKFDGSVSFAAAVCEWNPASGVLKAGRAADCEVWVLRDGVWFNVFPGDMLSHMAREAWDVGAPVSSDGLNHLAAHDRILGPRECWNTAPLGMFVEPVVEFVKVDRVDAVLVTTDGLKVDSGSAGDAEGLVGRLHSSPTATDGSGMEYPHGDLGFVRLDRSES